MDSKFIRSEGYIMAKRKNEVNQEELAQAAHERALKELEEKLHLISEPTYIFEIGEPVSLGALEDVVVLANLHEGKIVELGYTSVKTNYGNPIRNENQKGYWLWTEIRKLNSNRDSHVKNEDIRLSYSQMGLESLFHKAYYFGVDFDPEYQRNYVWNESDKVKLIDAIFNNVDIGKFAFIHLSDEEWEANGRKYSYEILDGKQRLRAILDFYESRFKYKGLYFKDMSPRDQLHFRRYAISSAETRNLDREQKLRYFLMLNTGGRIMSEEHLDVVRELLNEVQKS
ncbi:DUF262 domain-containing protein [Paenibacillus sp. 1781tsa1]|uniref:DUF262 domain-containing protein n=1 Tax=Paenibacillus sp. 1781tsa1 TaxID=2953810 RepID=UPI00209EC3DF|nr:DUF262 domain-containing protein [Paenibacillus sp. 1781tsa1]MCP1185038.1 DUF262 domain-containing protein [Paenibacillus sp. 1781tsa1]